MSASCADSLKIYFSFLEVLLTDDCSHDTQKCPKLLISHQENRTNLNIPSLTSFFKKEAVDEWDKSFYFKWKGKFWRFKFKDFNPFVSHDE